MTRTPLAAAAALALVAGCTSPTPAPSAAPTPSVAATSARPSTATPASATPTPTPTPTPSAASVTPSASTPTPSPKPSSAKPPAAPTITASCKLAISEQSGDPLIRFSYKVSDPAKRGWVATLRYTNDQGTHPETVSGKGDKSATETFYGIFNGSVKPNCKASIKAR